MYTHTHPFIEVTPAPSREKESDPPYNHLFPSGAIS